MNEDASFMNHMRKATVIAVGSIGLWLMLFSFVSAENITSFDAEIVINADSSLTITETITYDFDNKMRHGIFRDLSDQHAQYASVWYKSRYIDYELISVLRNNVSEKYTTEVADGLSIKIGDSNKQITGVHRYEITYKVYGALSEGPDGTELYWNATGNEWLVPMQNVLVTVYANDVEILADRYCYSGVIGSTDKCSLVTARGNSITFSQSQLFAGQGLTIAQAVRLPVPAVVLERLNLVLLELLIAFIAAIVVLFRAYRWSRRYKKSLTTIAQYEPLPEFKPMFTGVLFDNSLDSKDISAGVVYLAQQGFMSIKHIESKILYFFDHSDYEMTLLRNVSETETRFQKTILKLFFKAGSTIGSKMLLSDLKSDVSRQRQNALLVQKLKKDATQDLIEKGYLESSHFLSSPHWLFIIGGVLISCAMLFAFVPIFSGLMFIVLLISSVLFSKRRTTKGYEAQNYLEGFKDFLTVTDADRFAFHNAPGLSPQQFMEYLPYAIAFGVEKEWAEVFKDIHIDSPDWYISNTNASFGSLAFAKNISSFSQSFSGSTGSTGSTGSRGGGSSGGGSGGGGGGSW